MMSSGQSRQASTPCVAIHASPSRHRAGLCTTAVLALLCLLPCCTMSAVEWEAKVAFSGPPPVLRSAEDMQRETAEFEQSPPVARALQCTTQYKEFDELVTQSLDAWSPSGISLELIQRTIHNHTTRTVAGRRNMGLAVGFRGGRAVLLDLPRLEGTFHFPAVFFGHLRILLDLEKTFSTNIPDLDMVIAVSDMPSVVKSATRSQDPPLFRYSKTETSPDILIPNFHAYTLQHTDTVAGVTKGLYDSLVARAHEFNSQYPWSEKVNKAIFRGTPYDRRNLCAAGGAGRRGPGGSDICKPCNSQGIMECKVRAAFSEWAAKEHPDILDVSTPSNVKHVPMMQQAKFKYLIHLDGIGLSSRMEQLLPLGSLVFKEESGYSGYLYPLLKPGVHYLPFWKEVPEDLLEGLRWSQSHDTEAQRIALEGQAFAQRYTTRKARACYWFKLLNAYAKLLKYQPKDQPAEVYQEAPGGSQQPDTIPLAAADSALPASHEGRLVPISEYEDQVMSKHQHGKGRPFYG